mmetsp:Transcript_1781/g.3750  ORF Transcript_1781/g.3750 Transcript_1781/m.3750 type:complete len:91 (+) Transcript_1781:759-1031(+)
MCDLWTHPWKLDEAFMFARHVSIKSEDFDADTLEIGCLGLVKVTRMDRFLKILCAHDDNVRRSCWRCQHESSHCCQSDCVPYLPKHVPEL